MAIPWLIVASCAAAWGASPEADKDLYDVSVQWGLGFANSPDGGQVDPVHPWAVRVRASSHAIVDAQVGATQEQQFEDRRPASFRAGAGLQWAPYGLGLQGVSLGARVLAGPLPDGVRLEVNPNVRLNWIGHPGFTLGMELGFETIVCCSMEPYEPRVNGVALATIGGSFAVGDPMPRPLVSRAALSPEDARRRRVHNIAIAVTVPTLALVVATAFAVHELQGLTYY